MSSARRSQQRSSTGTLNPRTRGTKPAALTEERRRYMDNNLRHFHEVRARLVAEGLPDHFVVSGYLHLPLMRFLFAQFHGEAMARAALAEGEARGNRFAFHCNLPIAWGCEVFEDEVPGIGDLLRKYHRMEGFFAVIVVESDGLLALGIPVSEDRLAAPAAG